MMKHLFSFPRHFGVLMIAVLLQWCVMPASAQGWVENKQGFPTDVAITKIKLKDNGGKTSGLPARITLVFDMRGTYIEGACDISAKKLNVKTWGGKIGTKKTEFADMEEAEDGWRVYTLPQPAYFRLSGSSECCYTNVQFYVEDSRAIRGLSSSATNAKAASERTILYDEVKIVKGPSIPRRVAEEEIKLKTPEAEGYTLLETKKFNGYKCDYYLEGVATLRYDNGDFATFMCPQGSKISSSSKSVGDWRKTLDNGLVLKKEDGVTKAELFNGATLVKRSNSRIWYYNREGKGTISGNLDDVTGDLLHLPNQKDPVEYVSFQVENLKVLPNLSPEGYLVGDRLYTVSRDGELYSHQQIVDGVPYSALESDTIVEAVYRNDSLHLKYANGDELHLINDGVGRYYIVSGTIHRSGGTLTVKIINGNLTTVLTWPSGDKYAGEFLVETGSSIINSSNGFQLRDLSSRELKLYYGTLIKADGTRVQYENGKSEMEIAAEKKRKDAELTAAYNTACKKFGKQYVDAALEGQPTVGMPEELLVAVFAPELVESGYSKLYRIKGWGWKDFGHTFSNNALLYSVWVTNGRVSSVRYWGN